MKKWTTTDIDSQAGKTVVVTGGTSGIGYESARVLARAGAIVIITGRDNGRGKKSAQMITDEISGADVRFEVLDLASLQSVRDFAARIMQSFDRLDVLINNAGVMNPPTRVETEDGFELQFGANYLGHFALTKLLLPLLTRAKGRVVSLSSIVARNGAINFDDLQAQKHYVPMQSYAQSKVACLMFALELQRQSDANGWGITSIAAHPGLSRTNLLVDKGVKGYTDKLRRYAPFVFQLPAQGALPSLFAAVSPDARAGAYYGPSGFMELRGYPVLARVPRQVLDVNTSAKLWALSEKLVK